jgi:predicted metalloprotease
MRGGGGGGLPVGRLGIGGFLLLAVLSVIFKTDLFSLVGGGGGAVSTAPVDNSAPVETTPEEEKMIQFVSFVFDDVQKKWADIFARQNLQYRKAKIALFRDSVDTGCGPAQSAMGPFYCPADEKVYIDLSFYNELASRFGAPGDFAQAYVIAHEVGHHVQNQLGISDKVRKAQSSNPSEANALSVDLELQADCFAGVWGHATQNILDPGDIDEGLGAAAAVGDDRIQKQAGARVSSETWTHGSSEQRATWFRAGFDSGDEDRCNTFGG